MSRTLSFTDEELEVLTGYIGEALDTKKADRDRKELDSIYRKILE